MKAVSEAAGAPLSRRDLLMMIGALAGSGASYGAMAALGITDTSGASGPLRLAGDPKGASVLVLGAGLAGMAAALELRDRGYKVQILEYNARSGGRCWTLRGGDTYTELGGFTQTCEFDPGLYLNPGPWRIPYEHHTLLGYCRRLGVALEPFVQVSQNALLHAKGAFGGKPQRYAHIQGAFAGAVAELLAKVTKQSALDAPVTREDKEMLLEALRSWGALEKDFTFAGGGGQSHGVEVRPGAVRLEDLLKSGLWRAIEANGTFQSAMLQPAGGMDRIARAFEREVGKLIRYNAKVTAIHQDAKHVTVTYVDSRKGGRPVRATADWCVCTIPLTVLSQVEMTVSEPLRESINAIAYAPAVKIGLQFRRRFWEQDDDIYGGITYTDLPIRQIGYPNGGVGSGGKGVLLGAYIYGAPSAYEFTSLPPEERVRQAVAYGAQIHPQYTSEFENGISVGWHRVPWMLGCSARWTESLRQQHYETLRRIDGRIVLAGDHVSMLTAWQEGAVVSARDAITRLHERVMAARA
jgi:monoamine oxidase